VRRPRAGDTLPFAGDPETHIGDTASAAGDAGVAPGHEGTSISPGAAWRIGDTQGRETRQVLHSAPEVATLASRSSARPPGDLSTAKELSFMNVTVELGALAPPLASQLSEIGLSPEAIDRLQRSADSIVLLSVQGIISESEAERARNRLVRAIAREANTG